MNLPKKLNIFTKIVLAVIIQVLSTKIVLGYSSCDRKFYKSSGIVNGFNNGSSTRSFTCVYKIITPNINNYPSRAVLSWRKLDVDSNMPYCSRGSVSIKVGCNNPRTIARFCSRNMKTLPHKIYSPDNCITIEFYRSQYAGFIAQYTSVLQSKPQRTSCRRSITVYNLPYAILSSGWPVKTMESYCEWKIKLRKGQKIVMNVMDMNGYTYRSSSIVCPYDDYITIKGKKSSSNIRSSWYLCRNTESNPQQLPSLLGYRYYEMDIEIKISRNLLQKTGRGLAIGLVAYEEERLVLRFSSWTSVFVGIATIFIILLLLFCWYRRCRRRRLHENQPMIIQGAAVQTTQVAQPGYSAQIPSAYPGQQQYPPSAYPGQQYPAQAYPGQVPPPYQPPPYNDFPSAEQYPGIPGATAPPPGYSYPYPQQGVPPYPQQNPGYPAYPPPPPK